MNQPTPNKQQSSVRHTRAIARARTKSQNVAAPDEEVERLLTEVVHPATFSQVTHFQQLGLRERVLTLPVMVAFVLSLLWRHIGSVREAVRVLHQEGMLWMAPMLVTQQAMQQRLKTLPPVLFARILDDILPTLQQRWTKRTRPLTPALAYALQHFGAVLALDGATLDALSRHVGLCPETASMNLAGRMAALLDIGSLLPRKIWYEPDSQAHDQTFWEGALAVLEPGVLLLFDLGFVNHALFALLTEQSVWFVTRLKSNACVQVQKTFRDTPRVKDCLITLGTGKSICSVPLRMVCVQYQDKWYRYLTNVTDPQVLPSVYVVALYWQRWRIEEAYLTVKRLLGLSYFATTSQNGVEVQLWATWILYAVLTDLTDALAQALQQPFALISVEMVFRGLYHFTQAYHTGRAQDPIAYLATKARELALLKAKRPKSLDAVQLLTNQLKA
jgi:hypothetical protein